MSVSLPMHAPEKPPVGEPCTQCGYCCAAEVCEVGKQLHGKTQPAPCPSMIFDSGRFWCGAVLMADELEPMYGLAIRLKLGIGVGCDSNYLDEEEKDN